MSCIGRDYLNDERRAGGRGKPCLYNRKPGAWGMNIPFPTGFSLNERCGVDCGAVDGESVGGESVGGESVGGAVGGYAAVGGGDAEEGVVHLLVLPVMQIIQCL